MLLWTDRDMSCAYTDLDHPADLFLEIRGRVVGELLENALYALYRQITDVKAVQPNNELVLEVVGSSVETTLRALLAEALFRFEVDGFVAAGARVDVQTGPMTPRAETSHLPAEAHLWGETVDPLRHPLFAEVKAVTYHQLTATHTPDRGWVATVLLDV